jgi:hypothetical protein
MRTALPGKRTPRFRNHRKIIRAIDWKRIENASSMAWYGAFVYMIPQERNLSSFVT